MTSLFKFSRSFQAVTWTVIAIAAQVGLCGCKHVSRWSGAAPTFGSPTADPFEAPLENDGYFHGPGAAPLSPAPALPAPGHSIPAELPAPGHSEPEEFPAPPLPPPAPAEGAGLGASNSAVASKSQPPWALRPMSFLNRKGSRPEPMRPAADLDETPGTSTGTRTAFVTGNAVALPLSNNEPTPLSTLPPLSSHPENRIVPPIQSGPLADQSGPSAVSDHGISATTASASDRLAPRPSQDDSYQGPIITPGAQYTIGRDGPIENWPWSPRPGVDPPAVPLRKPTVQAPVADFEPVVPGQFSTPEPPAPQQGATASVPLLLPPGP